MSQTEAVIGKEKRYSSPEPQFGEPSDVSFPDKIEDLITNIVEPAIKVIVRDRLGVSLARTMNGR
ncbi:MAG TPA: hypothetical protein PLP21_14665 [Pyrinomonadaceae bacterium]|nr:hypothetical protein [Acidobacteriota bacterium]HQZ97561.1 hypothetical protein [Pyrinomonadaceae bacterium]